LIWIKAKPRGRDQSLENSFDAGEPTMIDTRALDLRGSILRTVTVLSGVSAAFLWLWVLMLEASRQSAGPLCSEATGLLAHCPLCYPAALATLMALAGWFAGLRVRGQVR
jgi:hypothetical protein